MKKLPGGSIAIADDILSGCGDVTILCPTGSPAETWATDHGYKVENN